METGENGANGANVLKHVNKENVQEKENVIRQLHSTVGSHVKATLKIQKSATKRYHVPVSFSCNKSSY